MFGGGFNQNKPNNMNAGAPSTFSFGSGSNNSKQNSVQSQSITSFGTVSNVNFGSSQQPSFGNNPFGQSPNVALPVNTVWNNNTPSSNVTLFGISSPGAGATTFNNNTSTTFGQSPFGGATSGSTSGFANSSNTFNPNLTTPTTAASFQSPFGTSSNVTLQKSSYQSGGNFGTQSFENSNTSASFGFKPESTMETSNTFGRGTATNKFPSSAFSTDKAYVNPFGPSSTTIKSTSTFGVSSNIVPNPFASFTPMNVSADKKYEQELKPMFGDIVYIPQNYINAHFDENADIAAKQDKLAELKAKLEEKKKKMMEIKMKQGQDQQMEEDDTDLTDHVKNPSSSLIPSAPDFVPKHIKDLSQPTSKQSTGDHLQDNTQSSVGMNERIPRKPQHKSYQYQTEMEPESEESLLRKRLMERNKSRFATRAEESEDIEIKERNKLSERNASRFATQQSRSSSTYLPADLVERAKSYHPSQGASRDTDVQAHDEEEFNVLSTKSLVGTCLQMCPDEEIVRRESEGDIQMLELPHADIYPEGFTLRDTAVKRFRRSAADFKLDIPELIRPPHVLEKVCGYLEEYVMERDRQGIDPRFGQVPSPLDVYQFIWDRTRMIRKDFILQNFIGTGGRCNATAVRCHERIARWHAMMEHQLAHIPEFLKNQSQQNIQELGQTMKTLNLYYDDAERRASVEDDSVEAGNLTHGCSFKSVRGPIPCDYNGEALINSDDHLCVSSRFIGNSSQSGISEEEMRGLYILLTINNDGGMEVLKYAARLSRDHPAIFNSEPVQFALEVYKARKEYNYARFFSLLRSPRTPYLYACIMFKYVETMRKACFKIMARTFGFKKRDDNESANDEYPLENLVHLLCFEDLEEARAACYHYNITCKKVASSKSISGTIDMIYWRQTEFKEPQDPSKCVVIALKPKKMNRTIESKLGRVTRLAVCRGEVSNGSRASITIKKFVSEDQVQQHREVEEVRLKILTEQKIVEDEQKKILDEAKKKEEEIMVQKKAREQKEQEQKVLDDMRKEEEHLRALESERLERQKAEAVAKEEEERRIALEEARKREEEEHILTIQRIEQERIWKEREIQSILEIKRKQEEMERQLQIQREAEEKIRRIQEEQRIFEELEKKRKDELERQRREREETDRQLELKWVSKIDSAKKLASVKKWIYAVQKKHCGKVQTYRTIEDLDAFPTAALKLEQDDHFTNSGFMAMLQKSPVSFEERLYRHGTDVQEKIDLSRCYIDVIMIQNISRNITNLKLSKAVHKSKNTFLFRLGLIVSTEFATNLNELVKFWLDSRLQLNTIQTSFNLGTEVRVMVGIFDKNDVHMATCDGLLWIGMSSASNDHTSDIPRVAITFEEMQKCEDLDLMLTSAFLELFDQTVQSICTSLIEKISLPQLICVLLAKTMFSFPNEEENVNMLPHHSKRKALQQLPQTFLNNCMSIINFAQTFVSNLIGGCKEPHSEFATGCSVARYFSDDDDLPLQWKQISLANFNQNTLDVLLHRSRDGNLNFKDFIQGILRTAPSVIHQRCISCIERNEFSTCILVALTWLEDSSSCEFCPIYLPVGSVQNIVDSYLDSNPPPSYRDLVQLNTFVETRESEEDTNLFELYFHDTRLKHSTTSGKRILVGSVDERKKQKREESEFTSDELKKCIRFTAKLKDAMYSDVSLVDFIQKDETLALLLSEIQK